jgi:hypothetical protein
MWQCRPKELWAGSPPSFTGHTRSLLILEINSKCSVSVSHCKSATIAHALALVYSEIALECKSIERSSTGAVLFSFYRSIREPNPIYIKQYQAISPFLPNRLRWALQDSELQLKGYSRNRRNSAAWAWHCQNHNSQQPNRTAFSVFSYQQQDQKDGKNLLRLNGRE